MSTKIRLRRMGKKKQPFYRIVVADSRMPRDGRAVEEIGTYNPVTRPGRITIKEERVFDWLNKGAQPSDTVNSLFRRIGVLKKWSLLKAGQDATDVEILTELTETDKPTARAKKTAAKAKAEAAEAEAPVEEAVAEAPAEEAAAEETPAEPEAEEPAAEGEADSEKTE